MHSRHAGLPDVAKDALKLDASKDHRKHQKRGTKEIEKKKTRETSADNEIQGGIRGKSNQGKHHRNLSGDGHQAV
jgi:hypothetical protein